MPVQDDLSRAGRFGTDGRNDDYFDGSGGQGNRNLLSYARQKRVICCETGSAAVCPLENEFYAI
jgi:hypothetical protein